MIDDPKVTDNRNYDYSHYTSSQRNEYSQIVSLIPQHSKVLDLGSGNGSLLELLRSQKQCEALGVEISQTGVDVSLQKGLRVIHGSIDTSLPFSENEFDFAVCNVTMQMVNYPEQLLREMKRVAKASIVSFPNFGFYRNRLEMLLNGAMPTTMLFGYQWFNTGHIHQLSFQDFLKLVDFVGGLKVNKVLYTPSGSGLKDLGQKLLPNLFSMTPIILLTK